MLLGLQYAVLDAFYLVLVAIIVRHSHATAHERVALMGISCIALAVGTLLQALRHGPLGSGFLAPPVFSATFMAPSVAAAETGGMRLVYGMTIAAGLMEALIAICLRRLRLVITPIISGITVYVVGLQLGILGIGEMLDMGQASRPMFSIHLLATLSTLVVCIALSIWGRGALRLLSSILGLGTGMVVASAMGLIDPDRLRIVGEAAWLEVPHTTMFDYGFDITLLPAFLAAGAAAAFRAVGVVTTCQRINNAAWRSPDMVNIRKGVLADGLANVAGGLLGTSGMTIGPGMVGISSATGATSRAIAFVAAAYLLILGLSPKLAGCFLLIPPEVAGAMMVFSACYLISGGMQLMLAGPVDPRAIYVMGISTLLALSENVFPHYFAALPALAHSLTASPLALGLTAALILTFLFRVGMRQRSSLAWDESTLAKVVPFLQRTVDGWKVAVETKERFMEDMNVIVGFLRQNRHQSGVVRVTYNGVALRTNLIYLGVHEVSLDHSFAATTVTEREELTDEEAAVFAGLRDFLKSSAADRKRVLRDRDRVRVKLSYETP